MSNLSQENFQTTGEVLEALKSLLKDVLQEALETELGPVQLRIPRDSSGEFEPEIVPKYERQVEGIEEKVIGLYSKGMTTRDISDQIKELYRVYISTDTVSNITKAL